MSNPYTLKDWRQLRPFLVTRPILDVETVERICATVDARDAEIARLRGLLKEAVGAISSAGHSCSIDLLNGIGCYCDYEKRQSFAAKLTRELAEPTKAQEVGK